MAKQRHHLRLICATVAAFAVTGALSPLAAAADTTTMLSVDQSRLLNTAVQLPASLRGCAAVPAGAVNGSDGWVFTQPVPNPVAFGYSLGFIDVTPTGPQPVVLLVTGTGVWSEPVDSPQHASMAAARTAAAAAARQARSAMRAAATGAPVASTPSPAPTSSPAPTLGPPPAGVSGALIRSGPDGVWLQTPEGWILAAAFLEVAVATDLTTFDVGAVCPAPDSLPAPSPHASASRTPGPHPTATTAQPRPTPTGAGTLPRTGTDVAGLAALAACLIVVGLVLVRIRRPGTR
ncbi:MAG TPA: hypothetical protein VJT31_03085 [Rugosimonospora sp.]|nr:hypothetical protein [Rugosimonospora sp.]